MTEFRILDMIFLLLEKLSKNARKIFFRPRAIKIEIYLMNSFFIKKLLEPKYMD